MHLLLLISAALSSQFTGISSNAAVFKISPSKVDVGVDTIVTVLPPSAGVWTTAVHVNVSLTATPPAAADTGDWIATSGDDTAGYVTAAIAFKDLENADGAIKDGDTVYVHIKHSTDTIVTAYGTIKYTNGWWMTCDPIATTDASLTNIKIQGPKDGWKASLTEIILLINDAEITVFPPSPAAKFVSDPLTGASNVWTVETLTVSSASLTLNPEEGLWAYVKYDSGSATQSNADVYEENGINLIVGNGPGKFTVTATATKTIADDTIEFTFAPTAPLTWVTDGSTKLVVDVQIDADHKITGKDVTYTASAWKANFDMTQLGKRLTGDKLSFKVKYDVALAGTGGFQIKAPFEVALDPATETATFDVKAPAEIDLRTMTTFAVTVQQKGTPPWTEDVYIYLTKDIRGLPPANDHANWKKATKDAGSDPLTYTLAGVAVASFPNLAAGDKVYAWVMHNKNDAANAPGTILPVRVPINVVESQEECDFTVAPLSINLSAKQKENITVTQTDKTVANLWPENVDILLSSTKQTPSAITVIVPTVRTGTSPNFVHTAADVDLKLITGLPTGGKLYVYVHYLDADDDDVYLPVPAEITITGDFPVPLFTIAPTEFDLKDGTTIDVVATQKAQETKWGAKVFLHFSLTPSQTPKTLTVKKEATYVAVAGPPALDTWKVAGFAPKTEFPALKKDDIIYVYAIEGVTEEPPSDGTVIAGDGRIAIKDTTPTAEFTVAPVKVDLQKDTTAEVVVTKKEAPAWTDDVFFHYSLTEITTQPDDDKFVKATLASGTYKHTLTLSTLTGIKKGDTIYVYVKPNVQAPASNAKTGTMLPVPGAIAVEKSDPAEAAMGVSPLLSLLAAALLLLVKLF